MTFNEEFITVDKVVAGADADFSRFSYHISSFYAN